MRSTARRSISSAARAGSGARPAVSAAVSARARWPRISTSASRSARDAAQRPEPDRVQHRGVAARRQRVGEAGGQRARVLPRIEHERGRQPEVLEQAAGLLRVVAVLGHERRGDAEQERRERDVVGAAHRDVGVPSSPSSVPGRSSSGSAKPSRRSPARRAAAKRSQDSARTSGGRRTRSRAGPRARRAARVRPGRRRRSSSSASPSPVVHCQSAMCTLARSGPARRPRAPFHVRPQQPYGIVPGLDRRAAAASARDSASRTPNGRIERSSATVPGRASRASPPRPAGRTRAARHRPDARQAQRSTTASTIASLRAPQRAFR